MPENETDTPDIPNLPNPNKWDFNKWDLIIPLILKVGLPVAELLWRKWASGKDPEVADWIELKAMAKQTARDRTALMLVEAGIDLDSVQAQRLLAAAQ